MAASSRRSSTTTAALAEVVAGLGGTTIDAVGHRVVHGGEAFSAPTIIDDGVLDTLRSLVPLAPLHNPANIAGIEAARRRLARRAARRRVRHRVPPHAAGPRLPLRRAGRVVRAPRRAALRLPRDVPRLRRRAGRRTARARAASTASSPTSATAPRSPPSRGGCSVDTSMGLSPLEGLVMGTRSGDVDPTVVTHVAAATGRPIEDVFDDLNRMSGLRGLCGASDMREITARAAAWRRRGPAGDRRVRLPDQEVRRRLPRRARRPLRRARVHRRHRRAQRRRPGRGLRRARRLGHRARRRAQRARRRGRSTDGRHRSPSWSSPPTRSWRSPARPRSYARTSSRRPRPMMNSEPTAYSRYCLPRMNGLVR